MGVCLFLKIDTFSWYLADRPTLISIPDIPVMKSDDTRGFSLVYTFTLLLLLHFFSPQTKSCPDKALIRETHLFNNLFFIQFS